MSVIALIAAAAVVGQAGLKVGNVAPAFSAAATDGKTHSLQSLTGEKDVFLYFISESCPVNAQAFKYYERLSKAYAGKARLVGVINADAAGYKAWAKQFKASFPVLYDPDLKIIRAYKANASPWMVQVSGGKVKQVWTGYSGPYLKQMSTAMASAGAVEVAKVDFSGAPADFMFG